MRNTITLNGQSSEEISGLLIQSLPPISKPAMRSEIEEIDGRDGDIVTQLGFSAYDKEISIGLYGDYDINEVVSFFNSEGTVVFSNEPDKYYNYQILGQIDFERLIRFKTATVTMHVQPFKYSTTEGALILSGTSLLSFDDFTQTTNGVTVTASNGSITVSGTPTAATEIYMPITAMALSAGDYTFEAYASGTASESCSLRVIYNSPSTANSFGGTYVTLANDEIVSINATLSEEKTYNYLYFYITTGNSINFTLGVDLIDVNSQTVSGEGSEIMLGDTAEAPFSMLVFKGDTLQQAYSGKNLYNATKAEATTNTVTSSADTGQIYLNGHTTTDFGIDFGNVSLPAGTYTLSLELVSGSITTTSTGGLFNFRGDNMQLVSVIVSDNATQKSGVITVTSPTTNAHIQLWCRTTETFTNAVLKYQLVSGNAADYNFEPYVGGIASPNPDYPQTVKTVAGEQTITISDGGDQSQVHTLDLGSIELCKIGDYQDYIYKDGDDWYLHKETWSYTFDGSSDEQWIRSGQSTATNFIAGMVNLKDFAIIGGNNNAGYCNYFDFATYLADNKVILSGYQDGGYRFLLFRFASYSTVTDLTSFKTWLGSHNIKVYLVLSTATDIQITDSTLLSQLEALETDAYSYKGQTIITTGANDENSLPHILEVEAYTERNGVLVNSGNIPARPILTIYGDGNIAVYLNGSQIFNIALGDEDNITIDTNAMEAYQGSTDTLKNRLVDGDYNNFKLKPGENLLEFSGVVDKCIVENYSRWL